MADKVVYSGSHLVIIQGNLVVCGWSGTIAEARYSKRQHIYCSSCHYELPYEIWIGNEISSDSAINNIASSMFNKKRRASNQVA